MSHIISSGEILSGIILENDSMTVLSGGTADRTTVNSGYLHISSGGTANDTTVNSRGSMFVYSGGTAMVVFNPWQGSISSGNGAEITYLERDANVYYGGSRIGLVSKADIMDSLRIESGFSAIVYSDGIANSTTVNSGGRMYVSSGGTANSTTVNYNGGLFVSSGGTANRTIISSGGILVLSSGGTATDIVWTPCEGHVYVYGGYATFVSQYSGVYYGSNNQLLSNAAVMDGMTINSFCEINIMNGGTAESTTVNSGGSMFVSSGGTANDTTVNSGGSMFISSSGTANDTTVNSGGSMFVSSGGTANSTTVNSDGYLGVSSGGTATIAFNPWQGSISSGNGAEITYLERDANVYYGGSRIGLVSKADIMDSLSIEVGFSAIVYSDGTANSTTVNSDGYLYVSSGGIANNTTVNSYGRMYVSSGGFANNTMVNSYGWLYVSSGGTANTTTINNYGRLYVSSGGTANDTMVNSGGSMFVSSGGCALNIDWTPCVGDVWIDASGYATFVSQYSGVYYGADQSLLSHAAVVDQKTVAGNTTSMYIMSGGIANSTTVNSGGSMFISSSGTANDTTVNSRGYLYVSSGGTANDTTVNSRGYLFVSSGGTATGIAADSGARLGIAVASNTYIQGTSAGSAFEMKNAFISGYTVISGGYLDVYSGGTANITTVNSGGRMYVSSGGTANSTTVNSFGSMYVLSGGTANITTVNSGGSMFVSSGGTANNTTVNGYGDLYVSSGGTATIAFNPWQWGTVDSGTGAEVTYLERDANVYYGGSRTGLVSKADIIDSLSIEVGFSAIVYSDGIANSTTVSAGGSMFVSSGGTAENTTINTSGWLCISSGGTANSTTVNSRGYLYVSSGGTANDTTVNYEGWIYVNSGGTANDTMVNSGGSMFVSSGGTVNSTMLNNGIIYIYGGMANSITVNFIKAGGGVYSGGTANHVAVTSGGQFHVFRGGTLDCISVNNGGRLYVSGGKLTGKMVFENGAAVSVNGGFILDFDLTRTEAGAGALVNDLSIIQGAPLYTLTVDGTLESGVYSLADGADGFNSTITVVNVAGDELGMLSVGQKVLIGDTEYTLNLNDTMTGSTLTVTVAGSEPVPPTPSWKFYTGDFNGDGKAMLAVETPEEPGVLPGSVTVYMNGEPWGLGVTLDPGWEVVGVGDFNADGRDDFLRVNTEGYVVSEMSNGNGTFTPQVLNLKSAGWDILGTGDFNGNGSGDVLVANPTGASETVGLLGYWKGGTEWTLINGYSPEWECVSTGDFNGDGKCDMLWRNSFIGEGGLTYNAYCTWIVDDPVDWRMVSVANPVEWNFLCSGDFDGNGMNDIAMINDVGVVGIWGVNDGYLSSWSILSAVDTSSWSLVGVGDFNADGTDDIAWCNNETNLAGYWQINDKQLTAWANLGTLG